MLNKKLDTLTDERLEIWVNPTELVSQDDYDGRWHIVGKKEYGLYCLEHEQYEDDEMMLTKEALKEYIDYIAAVDELIERLTKKQEGKRLCGIWQ